MKWTPVSGKAKLHSYVIGHQVGQMFSEASSILAVVELEEGLRLISTLSDVEIGSSSLSIGMVLEVASISRSGGAAGLTFRPVSLQHPHSPP